MSVFSKLFGGSTAVAAAAVVQPALPVVATEDLAETKRRQEEEARLVKERAAAEAVAELRREVEAESISLDTIPKDYARPFDTRKVESIESLIAESKASQGELTQQHKGALEDLLALEVEARDMASQEYSKRLKALQHNQGTLESELARARLDTQYPRLDTAFLKRRRWSHKENCAFPLFATFSPDNNVCVADIWYAPHYVSHGQPPVCQRLPALSNPWCSAVAEFLLQRASLCTDNQKSRYVSVAACFQGVIPSEARKAVKNLRASFDVMYLVTEAPDWNVVTVNGHYNQKHNYQSHAKPDPIPSGKSIMLVGIKQGIHWLITTFDTIPAEAYVAKEFSPGSLKA